MGLHDTIQPGFTFLVGVALPYSIHSRTAKGESFGRQFAHAIWRSLLLIALGIFLRSTGSPQTYFTFEDTLTQIGLGYTFAFLLAYCRPKLAVDRAGRDPLRLLAGLGALSGSGSGLQLRRGRRSRGLAPQLHRLRLALEQEQQPRPGLRRLVPQPVPARIAASSYNDGGYLTLSFIPTLGTMLLGLPRGRWFRSAAPKIPIKRFLIAGALLIAAGLLLHFTGICPIVKRIWTPGWTLFSGGVCFLFLAAFSWIIDVKKLSPLGLPAGRGGHEFDCGLPDRPPMGRLHHQQPAYQSWLPGLSHLRSGP